MSIRRDFEGASGTAVDHVAHVHAVIQLARDADVQFWSQEPPVDTEGLVASAKAFLLKKAKKASKTMTRKKTAKKKAKAAAKDASESDSDSGPDEITCKDKDGNTLKGC